MAPLGASSSTEMGTEIEKGAIQFWRADPGLSGMALPDLGPDREGTQGDRISLGQVSVRAARVVGDDGELVGLRRAVQDSLPPILAARCDHLKWIEINQNPC